MVNFPANLGQRLHRLERALASDATGREREWARCVSDTLDGLLQELRRQAAEANGTEGPLTEVDQSRPTVARQVTELQRQHVDLLAATVELCRQSRSAWRAFEAASRRPERSATIPDFGAIRRQGGRLLAEVRRHQERETDLVLDSVTTDIGVGD